MSLFDVGERETFDRNLHRGEPYSTSVKPYDAPVGPDGEMIRVHVALCKARRRGEPMCGKVIVVPWEHLPEVMSGMIDTCEDHRTREDLETPLPTATKVRELTLMRREAATKKRAIRLPEVPPVAS